MKGEHAHFLPNLQEAKKKEGLKSGAGNRDPVHERVDLEGKEEEVEPGRR